jgi:hypothetical protein
MEGVFGRTFFLLQGRLGKEEYLLINQQHGFSARYIRFVLSFPFDVSIYLSERWGLTMRIRSNVAKIDHPHILPELSQLSPLILQRKRPDRRRQLIHLPRIEPSPSSRINLRRNPIIVAKPIHHILQTPQERFPPRAVGHLPRDVYFARSRFGLRQALDRCTPGGCRSFEVIGYQDFDASALEHWGDGEVVDVPEVWV